MPLKRKLYDYTGMSACTRNKKCRWYREETGVLTVLEKQEKPVYMCVMSCFKISHNPMARPKTCNTKPLRWKEALNA